MSNEIHLPTDRTKLIKSLFSFLIILLGSIIVGTFFQLAYFYLLGIDPVSLFAFEGNNNHLKAALFITQSFTFLIPALLFAWIAFKQKMWLFLGFSNPFRFHWILMAVIMLFFLLPVIQYTYELNQALPLPQWMTSMEENVAKTLEAIIMMDDPVDLIINILLIALLPSLGEELVFRGILQQFGYRVFRRPGVSVWITAIIFSTIHFQFEGFIPRLILGLYLGYLFLWTNNLLVPIIAHFFNNALMIVLSYFNPEMITDIDETPIPELPWYLVMISAFCIIPLVIYFKNIYFKPTIPSKDYEF